jgi:NAD(P)H-dependent flavin oxidoreductase YrpB (nitropropane dioxygenase family)
MPATRDSKKTWPSSLLQKVHAYGGRVRCDVISLEQACKAAPGGVDLDYVGTPPHESVASEDYKNAIATGVPEDIVLSKAASGIPANLLKASLVRLGLDPAAAPALDVGGWTRSAAWSSGHGIGFSGPRQSCRQLVERLIEEHESAAGPSRIAATHTLATAGV